MLFNCLFGLGLRFVVVYFCCLRDLFIVVDLLFGISIVCGEGFVFLGF